MCLWECMPKPAGHASIHTHEVSYTTLPIPLRLGLSDTPVSVLSALLEAKAPPSFLPSFTLDLGLWVGKEMPNLL